MMIEKLTEIITVSQQILLRLSDFEKDNQDNTSVDSLLDLQVQRTTLIKDFFINCSPDDVNQNSALVEQMIVLDDELKQQSEKIKIFLGNDLLAFQKNKKATRTYQKY